MNKLIFLEKLMNYIREEKIEIGISGDEMVCMLNEIEEMVRAQMRNEIVEHITAYKTGYFAPEYDSWKTYFESVVDDESVSMMLNQDFTQEELEDLWQNSHIVEDLDEARIKSEMMSEIGQLKMVMTVSRTSKTNPDLYNRFLDGKKARIKGLFNILFE